METLDMRQLGRKLAVLALALAAQPWLALAQQALGRIKPATAKVVLWCLAGQLHQARMKALWTQEKELGHARGAPGVS